jgi:hypothetical protein
MLRRMNSNMIDIESRSMHDSRTPRREGIKLEVKVKVRRSRRRRRRSWKLQQTLRAGTDLVTPWFVWGWGAYSSASCMAACTHGSL